MNHPYILDADQVRREQSTFLSKVYAWMSLALAITAVVAVYTASSPELIRMIFSSQLVFFGLIIGELALVVWLSRAIHNMSLSTATAVFLGYAALNGLTFSVIFLVYTLGSIGSTFLVTAGTFGIMSAYGYYTKRDLTSIGNLLIMALVGLILASIVNIFWSNPILYWITTYAGVLIFTGLIAYHTQKIKNMRFAGDENSEEVRKGAILGALSLYLDFINLFLYMLRLFGSRK